MFDSDKETSKIALSAFWLAVVGIGLAFMYAALVVVGADVGHLVIGAMLALLGAFGCGLLSILHIAICHRDRKGLGYTVGALLLSFPAVWIHFEVSSVVKARERYEEKYSGTHNLRILGNALKQNAVEHDGCFPGAQEWCDVLLKNDPSLSISNFLHPEPEALGLTGECHFAFNSNLSNRHAGNVSPDTVLIFEADGDWNLSGTGELLQTRKREHNYVSVFLVDGSVKAYFFDYDAYRLVEGKQLVYRKLRWSP